MSRLSPEDIEGLVGESLEDMGLEEAFERDEHVAECPRDATFRGPLFPLFPLGVQHDTL